VSTAAHAAQPAPLGERWTAVMKRTKAKARTAAQALRRNSRTLRAGILQIGGLGLFTASAAGVDLRLGGVIAGMSCFVVNWLLTDPTDGRR